MIIDSNLILGIQLGFVVGVVIGTAFSFLIFRWF